MTLELRARNVRYLFDENWCGLPSEIVVFSETYPETRIAAAEDQQLTLVSGGTVYHPCAENTPAERYEEDGCQVLIFPLLVWRSETGKILPDFHLALEHRLYDDGAFFTTASLHGETSAPDPVERFSLKLGFDFGGYKRVIPQMHLRPGSRFTSKDIQALAGDDTKSSRLDGHLLAWCGFTAVSGVQPDLYGEVFLEGANTIIPDTIETQCATQIGVSSVEWTFQRTAIRRARPVQWFNRWGMVVVPPQIRRNLPPQNLYHYIDNYRHYPDEDELSALWRTPCTTLIIHSNWRRDAKNGGMPYDPEKLHRIIDAAHAHKVRVAFYIRGNEREVREEHAAWFDRYLMRDFDGLYMDYGSAIGNDSPGDENYPGGTINFFRHYLNLRALRKRVGVKGILFSHTGPAFSALGMGQVDAYVSGEAEKGALLRDREAYRLGTHTAAAFGSLWSAAFPEYGTKQVLPFIASSGHSPHIPLGMQFIASSLHHPPAPGVNDVIFYPLWKMWEIMAREQNVCFFSDENCRSVFRGGETRGRALTVSGNKALLLLADFGAGEGRVGVDWKKCGFDVRGKKIYRLTPGKAAEYTETEFLPDFANYPVCGFLLTENAHDLDGYSVPQSAPCASLRRYLAHLQEQRELRRHFAAGETLFVKLTIDNSICTALEDSNFFDLYDNDHEIVVRQNGKVLQTILLPRIQPGETSTPLALHEMVAKHGGVSVEVRSLHFGEPFYLFAEILLSNDGKEYRKLSFCNGVDPDRSKLVWLWR